MADWAILIVAGFTAWIGFGWLALAMPEHWAQVHGTKPVSRKTSAVLRLVGIVALIASASLCFQADRASMAVLVWLMLMSLSAALTALILASKPALLKMVFPVFNSGMDRFH